MSASSPADAFAALRHGEFRALCGLSFLLTSAIQIQNVAVGWALYQITRDPLVLGLVGLAEAIPFITLALFGGHLADLRDKRGLMRQALWVMVAVSVVLLLLMRPDMHAVLGEAGWLTGIYGCLMILGFARGLFSPAASALRAFVVPRALYPNASAWSGTAWQSGAVLGPALGGLLYAGFGLTATLAGVTVLMLAAIGMTWKLKPRPVAASSQPAEPVLRSVAEGLRFVRQTPVILYALSLDLFCVLFGGVVAILPMFAEEILDTGPAGLGILRAAPAVGAILTILVCTRFTPTYHAWRNLLIACAGFGAATLVFAVSTHFWLSAFALFATGAFDSVSVVVRNTLLQVYTPDALRGRVQAVNSVFISASNEIGAFESGLAAKLMGAVPSVILGGAATLAITGEVWRRSKALLAIRVSDAS
ncbi:MFS transporter [Flagellatimonas centrodinii]|uniref:MFS transporter n=1 Tax=Flagellatimonas centrodinii TaxID=2806210 RepID=UPI001FED5A4C|nr:MFS transporter [Flagellatimonas centrodinii]ULQ48210.1 MFS transporter [Flagellatimonas centrodinii]